MSRRDELDQLLGPCPLSKAPFAEQLEAHVTDPSGERIHGYSSLDDLARHYGWVEVLLLTLTGELPTRAQARAAEVALIASAGVAAGEAPAHAAIAARVIGAERPALVGIAALGLGEQVGSQLSEIEAVLQWLAGGAMGDPPKECGPAGERGAALYRILHSEGIEVAPLTPGLSDSAAIVALLAWAGLKEPAQIELALVTARLPAAVAEALRHKPRDLLAYPMNLPRFDHEAL